MDTCVGYDKLKEWDHRHLWHPFTQMQEWLAEDPLVIVRGEKSYLYDTEGRATWTESPPFGRIFTVIAARKSTRQFANSWIWCRTRPCSALPMLLQPFSPKRWLR